MGTREAQSDLKN